MCGCCGRVDSNGRPVLGLGQCLFAYATGPVNLLHSPFVFVAAHHMNELPWNARRSTCESRGEWAAWSGLARHRVLHAPIQPVVVIRCTLVTESDGLAREGIRGRQAAAEPSRPPDPCFVRPHHGAPHQQRVWWCADRGGDRRIRGGAPCVPFHPSVSFQRAVATPGANHCRGRRNESPGQTNQNAACGLAPRSCRCPPRPTALLLLSAVPARLGRPPPSPVAVWSVEPPNRADRPCRPLEPLAPVSAARGHGAWSVSVREGRFNQPRIVR